MAPTDTPSRKNNSDYWAGFMIWIGSMLLLPFLGILGLVGVFQRLLPGVVLHLTIAVSLVGIVYAAAKSDLGASGKVLLVILSIALLGVEFIALGVFFLWKDGFKGVF